MAGFVQFVEMKTSKFDEMQKVADKWREQTKGKRTTTRVTTCRGRDDPNQYLVIAEFPSYEAAMRNNDLPETQALSKEMMSYADGPPNYYNFDIVRVEED